jgi:DNA-binding NarL/FixJ family response regulator
LLNSPSPEVNTKEINYLRLYRTAEAFKKVELTPRENEVLALLIKGMGTKDIAKMLTLSKRTIEHHIENIKDKMHVSSKYELIAKAINYFG